LNKLGDKLLLAFFFAVRMLHKHFSSFVLDS
jgi:hypothetical protein